MSWPLPPRTLYSRRKIASLGAFLFAAITVPYLTANGYGVFDAEMLIIGAGSLAVGAILGGLAAISRILSAVVIGLLSCAIVDLYFVDSGTLPLAFGILLAVGLLTRLAPLLMRQLMLFSLGFSIVSLIVADTAVLSPDLPTEWAGAHNSTLPPVIHLILDEQTAPDILTLVGAPPQLADAMKRDYLQRGFALFDQTAAESDWTRESIASVLSLDPSADPAKLVAKKENQDRYVVSGNAYRTKLEAAGYRVITIRSDYVDFCDEEQPDCYVYLRGNHGHIVGGQSPLNRTRLLLPLLQLHLQASSASARQSVIWYRLLTRYLPRARPAPLSSQPLAMLDVMGQLTELMKSRDLRGTAIVAHLLMPHFPWMLDSDCQFTPISSWRVPAWKSHGAYVDDADGSIAHAYWQQSACAHKATMQLIDAVLASSVNRDARILIHGDHGPRLVEDPDVVNRKRQDSAEAILDLQTLLTIRVPSLPTGIYNEPGSLTRRVNEHFLQQLLPPAHTEP